MLAKERIIVALDVSTQDEAATLVKELAPHVGMFKIGLELTTAVGTPQIVRFLQDQGTEVFLDAKFKDIPTTMARASAAASRLGVTAFNVHASAGIDSMFAAHDNKGTSKAWAVTVLTSMDAVDCELVYGNTPPAKVLQFARDALHAQMDGIICSPLELQMLRKRPELKGLDMITPGVRPEWAPTNEQKRFMTPYEAIRAGATYLVIGRPLTKPPGHMSRTEAAKCVVKEIEEALSEMK